MSKSIEKINFWKLIIPLKETLCTVRRTCPQGTATDVHSVWSNGPRGPRSDSDRSGPGPVRGPSVNIFFFEGPRTWSGPDLWTFSLNNFFYKKFRDRKLNFFWSNWLLTLNYTRKSVAHCSLHIVFLTKITHLVWICNLFFRLQLCHCKYLIIPLFLT